MFKTKYFQKFLCIYIFDNFKEKQAKMLADCFIGHLGTKYNKTNNGFTCWDYETTMNITINNYNNLYLIKEQKIDCVVTYVVLIQMEYSFKTPKEPSEIRKMLNSVPKQIGNIFEEVEINFRENLNVNIFGLTKGHKHIYTGKAGSGNTHKMIEELSTQEKPLVLSFTNKKD